MQDERLLAPLFDDNPEVEDLLGFDGVAEAVVRVLTAGGLDPVTVGVQGAWGGGKSTVLNLIAKRLDAVGHVLVVRVDPWEFENSQDVRGTLIALVLNDLQSRVVSEEVNLPQDRKEFIVSKLNELRRRIAWGRVATVLVTSAVTMTPDVPKLIEALTPEGPKSSAEKNGAAGPDKPQSMAGFRAEFAALMSSELGITKVAVLVDDLDRCLPAAVVGTLEAVKLFLSVEKMAFVLAADEDLIRAAIDNHLGGLAQGDFAARYMEKIVQLPVSLPVLSQQDAEAYVGLLVTTRQPAMTGAEATAVIARARDRRRAGLAPYVVPDEGGAPGPDPASLALAATAARGLSADMWQTPRAVKRFLNNLAVREHIARAAGAELPLGVLVRLYVLELRHLAEFRMLAGLRPEARAALLGQWEDWAGGTGERPEGVDERTRDWAATKPSLAGRGTEIDRYLSFAATLRADITFGGAMDPSLRGLVERLLGDSDAVRRVAVEETEALEPDRQDVIVKALGEQVLRAEDPDHAVESLARLAAKHPRLVAPIEELLQRQAALRRLQPQHVPFLGGLQEVLTAVLNATGLDEDLVQAAREELGQD